MIWSFFKCRIVDYFFLVYYLSINILAGSLLISSLSVTIIIFSGLFIINYLLIILLLIIYSFEILNSLVQLFIFNLVIITTNHIYIGAVFRIGPVNREYTSKSISNRYNISSSIFSNIISNSFINLSIEMVYLNRYFLVYYLLILEVQLD